MGYKLLRISPPFLHAFRLFFHKTMDHASVNEKQYAYSFFMCSIFTIALNR